MGIGRWLAFLLALASIYIAGPFPLVDEGLRLGGGMAIAVVIVLLHHPLAKKFDAAPNIIKLLLWIVDLILLVAFLYTVRQYRSDADWLSCWPWLRSILPDPFPWLTRVCALAAAWQSLSSSCCCTTRWQKSSTRPRTLSN